tara:strand:- start:1103 stop:6754 length:5652 start_codon:yes stop_codon:yes gene_type:complete
MAGPIDIQKNCFYRKHNIDSSGAVKLVPSMTDSALSGTRDFKIEGGNNANIYLLSGATPPALTYGDGALIGGDLVLYCSGSELNTASKPPVIDVYAAVSGTTFTEGDMELSHGWVSGGTTTNLAGATEIVGTGTLFETQFKIGDDIKIAEEIRQVTAIAGNTNLTVNPAVTAAYTATTVFKPNFYGNELGIYTAHADTSLHTYFEGFDGSQTLGDIKISGYTAKKPYISLSSNNAGILANKLYAGGNYSLTYGLYMELAGVDSGPTGGAFFNSYFGTDINGGHSAKAQGVYGANNPYLFLKPLDENKLDDLWVPMYDFRDGLENIFAFTPYWRWKDIKGMVQFLEIEKTEVEESEEVTSNNTIFDSGLIFASANLSTYYGGGDATGVPVNKSIIQISNEAFDDGGSALQLYNLWSYSTVNPYSSTREAIDEMYGKKGAANPQYTCVGMKNVPYPINIDRAFTNKNNDSTGEAGTTQPAWSNVTLPEINIKFNVKEMDFNPTLASSKASGPKALQGVFTDYIAGNPTAGSTGSPVTRYDDTTYIAGTTTLAAEGPFDRQFRTLMRNFTVLFSNYPPNEGENLNDFLHRGLKEYYSGTSAGNLVVGGMTVFRDRPLDGTYNAAGTEVTAFNKGDGSVLTAMPLQTGFSSYAQGIASTATPGDYDIDECRNRIFKFNNCSGNTEQSADIMCFAGIPANDGNTDNATGVQAKEFEDSVSLSMDQFVNAKFCFNIQGGNKANAGALVDTRANQDQCRVYFTEGVVSGSATEVTTAGGTTTLVSSIANQTPSLPIYFPNHLGQTTDINGWTWLDKPALWPRYMTIWTTNYRNTNSTSVTTDELSGELQPWSEYASNINQFGLTSDAPEDVGADKQTNVFVDSISFSNFTNTTFNASSKAVGRTDNIIIKEWPIKSPVIPPPKYTEWATPLSAAAGGITMPMMGGQLTDYKMPTYVLMGFKNGTSDFYVSGGTGTDIGITQWYQWHGFGTPAFDKNKPQSLGTTAHSFSFKAATSAGSTNSLGNWTLFTGYAAGAYSYMTNATPTIASATAGDTGVYDGNVSLGATQPTVTSNLEMNFATGSNSYLFTDGLTQKGFSQFGCQTDNGADDNINTSWVKREHPFVSAKITNVPTIENDDGEIETGALEVDNVAIFDMPLDEEYILYVAGGGSAGGGLSSNSMSFDVGTATAPTFNYNSKATILTFSGSLTSGKGTMDLALSDFTTFFPESTSWPQIIKNGNYIQTGSLMAFVNRVSGDVDEIVRIDAFAPEYSATYARATITRGMLGTATGSRLGTDYYIHFVTNLFSVKGVTQRKAREGNNIFLDLKGMENIANDANLPYLYISPYKYWQFLQMWPGQVASDSGDVNIGYPALYGSTGGPKAYSNITLMKSGSAAITATGSTYSEENYTWQSFMTGSTGRSSTYNSLWNLHTDISGSVIESTIDYGLGPYNEETRTGGQVASRAAYSQYPTAYNLDGLIASKNWGAEEPVINKIVSASSLVDSSTIFYGNDYTTSTVRQGIDSGSVVIQEDVKPYYLWKYFDEIPTVSNFTVGPAFNLLNRETDLYRLTNENLNGIKFNWSESGEDIWYRMLILDNRAVTSKYHGFSDAPQCLFYGAMNDMPTSVTSAPTLTFKETTTDTTYGSTFTVGPVANSEGSILGTGARMSPEGLQGYAFDTGVSGAASKITISNTNSKFIKGATKYTAIFHLTPGVYAGATAQTIFERGTLGNGGLIVTMENGRIKVTMGGIATPLQSQTVSPRDGKQPMMVAVVYDKTGDVPCKLFINGKQEDYSITGTTDASEDISAFMCNNTGDSQPYYGLLEEVIFYGNVVHFPDDTGEYILDGSKYLEYNTVDVQSLHAKLFVMDYHNIRGDGKDVLCSTPTVSWRATIG